MFPGGIKNLKDSVCHWTGHSDSVLAKRCSSLLSTVLFTEERSNISKGRHPIFVVLASQPSGEA